MYCAILGTICQCTSRFEDPTGDSRFQNAASFSDILQPPLQKKSAPCPFRDQGIVWAAHIVVQVRACGIPNDPVNSLEIIAFCHSNIQEYTRTKLIWSVQPPAGKNKLPLASTNPRCSQPIQWKGTARATVSSNTPVYVRGAPAWSSSPQCTSRGCLILFEPSDEARNWLPKFEH